MSFSKPMCKVPQGDLLEPLLFVYFLLIILETIRNIHVIFSWAQIGRSAIFGREIGVPDREIFSRQKIFKFNVKNCLFASP